MRSIKNKVKKMSLICKYLHRYITFAENAKKGESLPSFLKNMLIKADITANFTYATWTPCPCSIGRISEYYQFNNIMCDKNIPGFHFKPIGIEINNTN